MKTATVAMFSTRARAEPLQRRLREAGVEAEIHDELLLARLWFVTKPKGTARIEVPGGQVKRAEEVLAEWDKEEALRDAIRCPECRSLKIQYPQFAHKSVTPNLVMGFLAALGHEIEHYCENCHYTWPREGTKASALRPHMAPYYFIEGVEQTTLSNRSGSEARTPV